MTHKAPQPRPDTATPRVLLIALDLTGCPRQQLGMEIASSLNALAQQTAAARQTFIYTDHTVNPITDTVTGKTGGIAIVSSQPEIVQLALKLKQALTDQTD